MLRSVCFVFFFFNDTATTEIYTLSLHDALPILSSVRRRGSRVVSLRTLGSISPKPLKRDTSRSEEHTSELQSQSNLVCRLLLEKKKKPHKHISSQRLPARILPSPPSRHATAHSP